MGLSSYECKHCGHSILHSGSVDPEINAWMKDVVMMSENGSRLITEYDGYEMHYEQFAMGSDAVWVHQACWEIAGKPDYDAYDGPSPSAGDQGHFFGRDHDMIDPRITDEAERERLLAEGIEIREKRWYDGRARKVAEWLDPDECRYHSEDKKAEPWRHRFSFHPTIVWDEEKNEAVRDENGDACYDGFSIWDNLDSEIEYPKFHGTEDELKAHLASLWAQFVESDECKTYIARRKELRDNARAEELARLRAEGRYQVTGKEAKGDTVVKEGERDWTGRRTISIVRDRMTYETVAVFDGPNKALGRKTFQGKYPEDRIEAMRAAGRESSDLAHAEAKRLNEQWAADGYPWDWDQDDE